jgi:DNA-binding transcriptional LysR family regulator
MLNLETLQLFCDLLETNSFSRAAEKNFVTQSAVSQRLRTLEAQYGQTLIERGQGRGGLQPTAAGQDLYDGAKRLLREARVLEEQLREASDEAAGTVRVATVYSVGLHALPPRLKPFLTTHPRINVHLEYKQTGEVYKDVVAGSVDVGIVACPTARRGLAVLPFGDEAMSLICAPEHPLARAAEVRLRQIDGLDFIGFADDIPTRKLVDDRLRAAGVRVRVVNSFDNIETIKNLVEIGPAVSIVPADTARQEERTGTLVTVPFVPAEAFRRPTGLLVKAGSRRAAVRVFLDAMQETEPSSAMVTADDYSSPASSPNEDRIS